ncbi:hypothetical protein TeGR_g927 [Tetraparma gracilis]|uniref:Uncharacterized protein n=1 Tax=Tetraparma gracilis TaxID=2962635 RepID=A0ABQ6M6R6_9STRA|nr:hypothetical protein TeGR_g927 [Tetraparma gracilis]
MDVTSLTQDPDIAGESIATPGSHVPPAALLTPDPAKIQDVPRSYAPLNIHGNAHQATPRSAALVADVGGPAALLRMTTHFYNLAFKDPHLDKFIRDRTDPHAQRFANWITEKLGVSQAWTDERRTRPVVPIVLANNLRTTSPHDRSTAHGAAWSSPKRDPADVGRHFDLTDCRVWMRLHFWALKKAGLHVASPSFTEYYARFLGHFVRVYERRAPAFARDSYRWSDNPANLEAYAKDGKMTDLMGMSATDHVSSILVEEARDAEWPYYMTYEDQVNGRGVDDSFYP